MLAMEKIILLILTLISFIKLIGQEPSILLPLSKHNYKSILKVDEEGRLIALENDQIEIWDLKTKQRVIALDEANPVIGNFRVHSSFIKNRFFLGRLTNASLWSLDNAKPILEIPASSNLYDISEDMNSIVSLASVFYKPQEDYFTYNPDSFKVWQPELQEFKKEMKPLKRALYDSDPEVFQKLFKSLLDKAREKENPLIDSSLNSWFKAHNNFVTQRKILLYRTSDGVMYREKYIPIPWDDSIKIIRFLPNFDGILISTKAGDLLQFDLQKDQVRKLSLLDLNAQINSTLEASNLNRYRYFKGFDQLAIHPTGNMIALGDNQHFINVYKWPSGNKLYSYNLEANDNLIHCDFTRDGKYLYLFGKNLVFIDLASGKTIYSIELSVNPSDVSFTFHGHYLIVTELLDKRTVSKIHDLKNLQLVQQVGSSATIILNSVKEKIASFDQKGELVLKKLKE